MPEERGRWNRKDLLSRLNEPPMLVSVVINRAFSLRAQVDSGCGCYSAISERMAQRVGLTQIPLNQAVDLSTVLDERRAGHITRFVQYELDVDGFRQEAVAYVIPGMAMDVILGLPWMRKENVSLDAGRGRLVIGNANNMEVRECPPSTKWGRTNQICGVGVNALMTRARNDPTAQISFATTSLHEISKALEEEQERGTPTSSTPHLPPELAEFKDLFDEGKAKGLPPHRGQFDHHIRLQEGVDGRRPALPWGPLYNMPRDQLLELRRQITDLMDKGWVRASASPAAAPVLLVKKGDGSWRFCVDYRALNKITKQDRYPLPLVKETLRSLSKATWFTKVDVRSAFHKIRMAEGQEHLTAFRTRFGLFEWLVCPFGLAGAPATFQRYINSTLGDILEDFVTAYLDDVLVFSTGSKKDHMTKVKEVLKRLSKAGLNLDLKKCEFAVKEVKYLGFIVEAGVGIKADPEKVRAIREWAAPRKVREVRSFLGFANFYRDFVQDFSDVADPLVRLTKRSAKFTWGQEEEESFQRLKTAFISAPILTQWDPDKETLVEADCSNIALGGCLSQRGDDGILRPVAYHSARLSAAERNYTIHDKELLAVISCLRVWSAELRSVKDPFTILSDHKGLEYFTKPRELTERQMRWSEVMSMFRFHLHYRPGRQAERPDALSRRGQDDTDTGKRYYQLLRPVSVGLSTFGEHIVSKISSVACQLLPVNPLSSPVEGTEGQHQGPKGADIFRSPTLIDLWDEGVDKDEVYHVRLKAVQEGARSFPKEAETREQIGNCGVNAHNALLYKGRIWLPSWEPLTTHLLQTVHDSTLTGHQGVNGTFRILQRDYHWDGMADDVKSFVRRCDVCKRVNPSRQLRQGLLQPLPIAERFWSQISIDFMTDLPSVGSSPAYLMVITDRLSKYIQLEAMTSMSAEVCAERFRDTWWRFHGFPNSIISDRGSNWVGRFWTTLCEQTGTRQLLSTAYHPETDGGTERANQDVQKYLRAFVCFSQLDWPEQLAACQLSLNNRDSTITGVSPNRLLNGFDISPVDKVEVSGAPSDSPKGRAVAFLEHLKAGQDMAQAAMAFVQQGQERSANKRRRPAPRFEIGDKVWLSLRNIKTERACKKLDWLYDKYEVVATPSELTVTLNVPRGIHPTFHVELVERAEEEGLPSQERNDGGQGPVLVTDELTGEQEEEYEVEEILRAKNAPGRGSHRKVLVKWVGWDQPTWEPLEALLGNRAIDEFEAKWGNIQTSNGPNLKKRGGEQEMAQNRVDSASDTGPPKGAPRARN